MRRLYIYCAVMLVLIVICIAFLISFPKLFSYNDYHPPDQTEASSDCFEKLAEAREKNSDVYAWISIPGTDIDYPVVQSPTSDSFYRKRNAEGKYSTTGSILTECTYNSTTFADPVTVIFGNCMKSGAMFGKLQSLYSSENGLEDYQTIEIYLPDQKMEYEVFAAVPYDTNHILSGHDFSIQRNYDSFFKSIVSVRAFNAYVNIDKKPEYGDKVLILSTALRGDSTKCYLVLAKIK